MSVLQKREMLGKLDREIKHLCGEYDKAERQDYRALVWREILRLNRRYIVLAAELTKEA